MLGLMLPNIAKKPSYNIKHRSAALRLSVIGCGHVGLVTGACFAAAGHQVRCTDANLERIALLNAGALPISEPQLDSLIHRGLSDGSLEFKSDVEASGRGAEAAFFCVGVPQLDSGESDFSALDSALRLFARGADSATLVVQRSTVPVQTGEQLRRLLAVYSQNAHAEFRIAANPQLLRQGTAIRDFLHPDRLLIGVEDEGSEILLRQIYAPILERRFSCPVHSGPCPSARTPELIFASLTSAELIKQVSNAFLALKISYANVLADLCERLGADVEEVTHAIGLDSRIGAAFFGAGLGFGGSRLPNDLCAFRRLLERMGVDSGIIQAAEGVNNRRVEIFLEKVGQTLWVLKGKRIGLLGLAHKANTDDVRQSPGIELCNLLKAAGSRVQAYDPAAMPNARAIYPDLSLCADAYAAADRADALLITTDWDEFRDLDWARVRDVMIRPLILDGRNLLSASQLKSLGFEYHCVGRPD